MTTLALQNWWYLVLRGAFSILFGLTALIFPWPLITSLMLLFGAYALTDGLIAIVYAIQMSRRGRVWALLIEGSLGIAFGVATFLWPHLTARMLLYLIASWAIVTGVLEIAAMAWLRRIGLSSLFLAMSGVVSVVLGVALFFAPEAGMVALTGVLGGYALIFGLLFVALGLHFRRLCRNRSDADGFHLRRAADGRIAS
jgi:uncharacterized membrane protein HdeD (DUF308 family)